MNRPHYYHRSIQYGSYSITSTLGLTKSATKYSRIFIIRSFSPTHRVHQVMKVAGLSGASEFSEPETSESLQRGVQ